MFLNIMHVFKCTVPFGSKPRLAGCVSGALVRAPVVTRRALADPVSRGRAVVALALVGVAGRAAGQAGGQVVPVLRVMTTRTRHALGGLAARAGRLHARTRRAQPAAGRSIIVGKGGCGVRNCSSEGGQYDHQHGQQQLQTHNTHADR